ncbi:MAG: BrnT family toxin [Candidatus Eisenbacteria bacterium]|nr:BrnT family toxin [Candidatus Eisenbacteria bacterium]MCC7143572.1 BrnT family toxin [Candidatus Eisenbacteria bacterium]
MLFQWDADKARLNLRKHRVDFEDACTIFGDPFEITIVDPDHSRDEQRFLSVGRAHDGKLYTVSYTERGAHIRLISARLANRKERLTYEEDQ